MVECSQERLFSVVWACRGQLNALNTCLGGWTGAEGLEDAKRRWVRAGRLDDWHTDLWPEDAAERAAFERRKSERLGGKKSAKDDARKSRLSGGGSMGGGGVGGYIYHPTPPSDRSRRARRCQYRPCPKEVVGDEVQG